VVGSGLPDQQTILLRAPTARLLVIRAATLRKFGRNARRLHQEHSMCLSDTWHFC